MDLSYQHSHHQRVIRQRNLFGIMAALLAALSLVLLFCLGTRDREIVLQPVLRSPLAISSSGVSRDYLEMITRDVVLLTLNRSPQNLEYWLDAVLDITAPRVQGAIKADLLKIVEEQRGSSVSQFFTIQSMSLDTGKLRSEVTGDLNTVVGSKLVSRQRRTFRYDWEYSGLSLKLVGFGIVEKSDGKDP
ncbi:type IV conjugative transfer system protein TraE [Sphingobium sp. TKS]|uniref:type IV conjugative transfer system protein TraE n=1 Tax=Sphingobium sp. TKS TaxID=1315974 RepID=UPI00076FFDD8|nr:type IV conjugative transfer system protein TraE [Sphingobium sp. TKS]AMK26055.1 TraE family protein [Sphingobium sp. TKS]